MIRHQAWAFLASLGAAVFAVAALLRGDLAWAAVGGLATAGLWMIARRWNRESPGPFPYVLRWFLRLPRPYHSPKRLTRILQPRSGEHLLEIGPGIGTHSLPVASAAAYNNLAVAYEQAGQVEKACAAYLKALQLEPKNLLIAQNHDLFEELHDRTTKRDDRH